MLKIVWLLLETFQCFFNERAAASEKILRKNVRVLLKSIKRKKCETASERKLCPLKKYFEVKKRLK